MRPVVRSLGLLGRITAILLIVIVIEFGTSTFLYERATHFSVRDDEARRLAEHLTIARKLISERPIPERPAMARELTTERYDVQWKPGPPPRTTFAPGLDRMRSQILAWEPDLARSDLHLRLAPLRHGSGIAGDLRLPDNSRLFFSTRQIDQGWSLALSRVLLALAPALVLILLGGAMIRRTLRPLRALIRATGRVGIGDHQPVREEGSSEVRSLIHAFNEMQLRIGQLIESRTQALAAVGHDLRTPLARLQLRLEAAGADEGARRAMADDLAEMEAMLASLLAFLGGAEDPEPKARADVAVMAATLVDDAVDRGARATYSGPSHLEMWVRRSALRRALANLVENAIHYGGSVHMTVEKREGSVTILVEDDGPGIPADQIEEVLRPFVRLDTARGRNTGGLGLGLAIVAEVIANEGGTLILENREQGGLRARIDLPAD
jgi:signal transduction histidine kinase